MQITDFRHRLLSEPGQATSLGAELVGDLEWFLDPRHGSTTSTWLGVLEISAATDAWLNSLLDRWYPS